MNGCFFCCEKEGQKKLYVEILKNDFLTYMNCKLAEYQVLQNV